MNKKFIDKFFKLYTKCSEIYAEYLGLEKYLIISYYKDDNLIYTYQYIDFNLLLCDKTNAKNNSEHPFLSAEFDSFKMVFLNDTFKNDDLDGVVVLDTIFKKIKVDFNSIQKNDVLLLNDIYKSILLICE